MDIDVEKLIGVEKNRRDAQMERKQSIKNGLNTETNMKILKERGKKGMIEQNSLVHQQEKDEKFKEQKTIY